MTGVEPRERFGATRARVVDGAWADEVISPAYDAMSLGDRRAWVAAHPDSYLQVIRGADDIEVAELRPGQNHLDLDIAALGSLLDRGAFGDEVDGLWIVRLALGDHSQLGVVGDVPVGWVASGQLLGHEQTWVGRAQSLVEHRRVVGAESSPVVLTHRSDRRITEVVTRLSAGTPVLDTVLPDGLAISLWPVPAGPDLNTLVRRISRKTVYITDGHHRVLSSSRHAAAEPDRPGVDRLLAAMFAEDQLKVEAFHRVLHQAPDDSIDRLRDIGVIEPVDQPELPTRQGEFLVNHRGDWWTLGLDVGPDEIGPEILQNRILGPAFDILDPTTDPRLAAVPGTEPIGEVARRTQESRGLGFVLRPVSVAQMMVEADKGRVLPPKSTYFVPKMRSGIFVRQI